MATVEGATAAVTQTMCDLMGGGYLEVPDEYFYLDEVQSLALRAQRKAANVLPQGSESTFQSMLEALGMRDQLRLQERVGGTQVGDLLSNLMLHCGSEPAACVVRSGDTVLGVVGLDSTPGRYISLLASRRNSNELLSVKVAHSEYEMATLLPLFQRAYEGYLLVPSRRAGKAEEVEPLPEDMEGFQREEKEDEEDEEQLKHDVEEQPVFYLDWEGLDIEFPKRKSPPPSPTKTAKKRRVKQEPKDEPSEEAVAAEEPKKKRTRRTSSRKKK